MTEQIARVQFRDALTRRAGPRREASGRMPVATRAAWEETGACPLSAGHRLCRPGPAGSVLGRRAGLWLAPAPAGFATWNDFYRELGVPEEELVDGADRISDPEGHGPSIWFHVVPDAKAVKNRLHLDIHASGERTDPIETRRSGSTRRPAGCRPGRLHHWRIARGRAGPLRGRDEGPRRQRVRYQLTAAPGARIT